MIGTSKTTVSTLLFWKPTHSNCFWTMRQVRQSANKVDRENDGVSPALLFLCSSSSFSSCIATRVSQNETQMSRQQSTGMTHRYSGKTCLRDFLDSRVLVGVVGRRGSLDHDEKQLGGGFLMELRIPPPPPPQLHSLIHDDGHAYEATTFQQTQMSIPLKRL